jgi:hypothetical protein
MHCGGRCLAVRTRTLLGWAVSFLGLLELLGWQPHPGRLPAVIPEDKAAPPGPARQRRPGATPAAARAGGRAGRSPSSALRCHMFTFMWPASSGPLSLSVGKTTLGDPSAGPAVGPPQVDHPVHGGGVGAGLGLVLQHRALGWRWAGLDPVGVWPTVDTPPLSLPLGGWLCLAWPRTRRRLNAHVHRDSTNDRAVDLWGEAGHPQLSLR